MKKISSTLILILISCFLSFAQNENEYKETLKTMFEISGSEDTYQAAITQVFSIFKGQYAEVKEETWTELEKEFQNTSMDDLIDLLAPVYQKHLTIDDLKELIKFYETPVGKKFASKTPFITQESMQVGQEWGMKIGQEFSKKMTEKGF